MDIQKVTSEIANEQHAHSQNWKNGPDATKASLPNSLQPSGHWKKILKKVPVVKQLIGLRRKFIDISHWKFEIESEMRELKTVNHKLHLLAETTKKMEELSLTLSEKQSQLERTLLQLDSKGKSLQLPHSSSSEAPTAAPVMASFEWDAMYHAFEQEFRGSKEDIENKQRQYVKRITSLNMGGKPVCDLGCGRGEWLDLLSKSGLETLGVEPNQKMVEVARGKHLSIECADALDFLARSADESFAGVSSFHVVEHLQFEYLFRLLKNAYRTVSKGGFILLETPNPENLVVGSCSFYMDPTHVKPIPPDALRFYVEQAGFAKVEIIRTCPLKENVELPNALLNEIAMRYFGPQDYAVFGQKI